jgi:protein-S-isoprenylcysteine O-methyltransferase Ste14
MTSKERGHGPDLIAPPPVIFAAPWLAGVIIDRLIPLPSLPRGLRIAGVLPLAAGMALGSWFVASMYRARTPIDPREAPTALVTTGPFQYTRNPGYLGLALCYAGLALLAGSRWALILLAPVLGTIDRGVVKREERYLEAQFGSAYREYRRRVQRWL